MSDPSNSSRVLLRIRATSSATLPLPMTTASLPPSGGARSAKSGWPLYQPTNAADPTTPASSSPSIPSLRSCGAPVASTTASYKSTSSSTDNAVADPDIADEADTVGVGDLVIAFRDRLDRLMIGRDAEPDQSVRHGQFVDDVDRRAVAIGFGQRFGRIETCRTRSDDGEVPHAHRLPQLRGAA